MRKFVLYLAIAVIAGGFGYAAWTGGPSAGKAVTSAAETPTAQAVAVAETAAADDCAEVVLVEDAFSPALAASKASCCIDRCRRDRDCDAFCGAKGAGVCLQVNSCCRDCACTF